MVVRRLGNGSRLILPALPLPGSEFDLPDDRNQARSCRSLPSWEHHQSHEDKTSLVSVHEVGIAGSSRTRWSVLIPSRPKSITVEFRSSQTFRRWPPQIADGDDSFHLVGTSLLRPSSSGRTRPK